MGFKRTVWKHIARRIKERQTIYFYVTASYLASVHACGYHTEPDAHKDHIKATYPRVGPYHRAYYARLLSTPEI